MSTFTWALPTVLVQKSWMLSAMITWEDCDSHVAVKNEACLGENDMCEFRCCHSSKFIIEAPGHMSEIERMSIFKPSKWQRVVHHRSACTCSESASGTKYGFSLGELIVTQHSYCLGSAWTEDENLVETESSSDKKNSCTILLLNKDAALLREKDDFSPASHLKHLQAESHQMVTDLEYSAPHQLWESQQHSQT